MEIVVLQDLHCSFFSLISIFPLQKKVKLPVSGSGVRPFKRLFWEILASGSLPLPCFSQVALKGPLLYLVGPVLFKLIGMPYSCRSYLETACFALGNGTWEEWRVKECQ
jgi:hypothetical protein